MATVAVSEKKGQRRWSLLIAAMGCVWVSLPLTILLWPVGILVTGLLWIAAIMLLVMGSGRRGRLLTCSACGARLSLPLPFACPSCQEALSWGDNGLRTLPADPGQG